jgi:hypothetical protein
MFLVYISLLPPQAELFIAATFIRRHFGGPDLSKYKGRCFDLDFLEGD